MNFKKTYSPQNGYTPLCTIGQCSLKDLEFGIIELGAGQKRSFATRDRETAFVMLWGTASFAVGGIDYGRLGVRTNVFASQKAECFYAGRGSAVEIESVFRSKIAVCATPIDVDTQPQAIRQADVRVARLGVKPWERGVLMVMRRSAEICRTLYPREGRFLPGGRKRTD